MSPEKVTEMILNVDLKCSGCYKKVKKVISKIPQIRDQVFYVDKNKVKIMVVCCSPENIRDKLCYKGGGAIQSIEIIEKSTDKPREAAKPAADKPKEHEKAKPAADKPKEPEKAKPAADKPKEPEKAKPSADKPKEPEKAKPGTDKPKEPEKPKPADKPKEPEKPKPADKPKDSGKPAEPQKAKPADAEKPKEADKPSPPKVVTFQTDPVPNPDVAKMVYEPVHGYPHMHPSSTYPMVGYGPYYDHYYGGAPLHYGYGTPVEPPLPPPSYGGFGYENEYNGYNGKRSHYASNEYGSEDDGEGCSIM